MAAQDTGQRSRPVEMQLQVFHRLPAQFMLTVWRRVLTPMQVAHMNVTSYPGHTDILRIAEVPPAHR